MCKKYISNIHQSIIVASTLTLKDHLIFNQKQNVVQVDKP